MNRASTKVGVPDLSVMKERGERIVMLTAYDATMARLPDRAGIDLLLVGASSRRRFVGSRRRASLLWVSSG
jgi:3-methyl-2-oxobutanoate hydroxymethyltransferase